MLTYGRDYRSAIKNTLFLWRNSFKRSLPMAGSRRQLMLIRYRRQHGFTDLQEAAADGRKVSQTFKKLLPAAGGFRKPSKGRCRWQEGFTDLQKAAAGGGRFS